MNSYKWCKIVYIMFFYIGVELLIHILIADDDKHIRNLVEIHLKEEGFNVLQAENGEKALEVLASYPCDLAIVDIMMPVMDGYELTRDIRQYYDIPIILLTAKDQIEDKEKGFLSGTDDYLVKPFDIRELIFRIRTLFRLYDKNIDEEIKLGDVTINRKTYEVSVNDQTFLLPLKEFELLYILAAHQGQVFTRGQLIERIWGFDYEGDERTVDVHIKRLRERFTKVTDDFEIITIRGVGYALEENK